MDDVMVLGTGMAAWGAANRLCEEGVTPVLYDKCEQAGGHTKTYRHDDGFVFDDGPHISFTKDERVQGILSDAIDGDWVSSQTYVDNYYKGTWVRHPAQVNLHPLPHADRHPDSISYSHTWTGRSDHQQDRGKDRLPKFHHLQSCRLQRPAYRQDSPEVWDGAGLFLRQVLLDGGSKVWQGRRCQDQLDLGDEEIRVNSARVYSLVAMAIHRRGGQEASDTSPGTPYRGDSRHFSLFLWRRVDRGMGLRQSDPY